MAVLNGDVEAVLGHENELLDEGHGPKQEGKKLTFAPVVLTFSGIDFQ